jgi:hypothetical protein
MASTPPRPSGAIQERAPSLSHRVDPRVEPEPEALDLSDLMAEEASAPLLDPAVLSELGTEESSYSEPVDPVRHLDDPQPLDPSALAALDTPESLPADALSVSDPPQDDIPLMEGFENTRLDPSLDRPRNRDRSADRSGKRGAAEFSYASCPSCGAEQPQPAPVFCESCGQRLKRMSKKGDGGDADKRCGECGFRNKSEASSCTNCGSRLKS